MALVINPQGETIYRQAKIQLVGGDTGWARPGNALSTFQIDDKTCSLIICHDSRYPELVRIPVIKGARLVFYLSWESDIRSEYKIEPYRAQVVARAVENNVYIVHANAPQSLDPLEGSHGQSRIVGPDGVIFREASILGEEMIIADLDVSRATGSTALKSLRADFLKEWWQEGMEKIDIGK
jgi:predicted amidohydrolase